MSVLDTFYTLLFAGLMKLKEREWMPMVVMVRDKRGVEAMVVMEADMPLKEVVEAVAKV